MTVGSLTAPAPPQSGGPARRRVARRPGAESKSDSGSPASRRGPSGVRMTEKASESRVTVVTNHFDVRAGPGAGGPGCGTVSHPDNSSIT